MMVKDGEDPNKNPALDSPEIPVFQEDLSQPPSFPIDLSKSWLLASLEAESWIDEEPFELVTFSAAVKVKRLEREAELLPENCDLLKEIGHIYIGRHCKVPKKDLHELINMAGGSTVNQLKLAKVILAHDFIENLSDDQVQVGEKWVLDSLQQFCPLPFVDYLIEA